KANRRQFVKSSLLGGLAAALPAHAQDAATGMRTRNLRYAKLDEILKEPVLKRQLFPDPVIIETLELLRFNDNFLCRVRSRDVAEYDAHALKIKIGGLMFMTTNIKAVGPPGRTEKIIPLIRKTFGDRMTLYADANGFYSVAEAIRVGKLLEEYRYGFFEEPVM